MLRGEGLSAGTKGPMLNGLRNLIENLRAQKIAPYDRPPFEKLLASIAPDRREVGLMNDAHHKDDGTIGLAEAADVRKAWQEGKDSISLHVHTAFRLLAEFDAHRGPPNVFAWPENVVPFPAGLKDGLATLALVHTGIAAAAKTDGRAGDGLVSMDEWDPSRHEAVRLNHHELFRLTANTLEPAAAVGDFLLVRNHLKKKEPNRNNLVVARVGERLLARRFNRLEDPPDTVVLSAQAIDPQTIAEPVILPESKLDCRKVVGVLFAAEGMDASPSSDLHEIEGVDDASSFMNSLDQSRLFKVEGRSAEPIALHEQYLITGKVVDANSSEISRLDGRPIVAVDAEGCRYFKRLRLTHHGFVVLESLNPDGSFSAELLSLGEKSPFPKLDKVLPVLGILFEIPGKH